MAQSSSEGRTAVITGGARGIGLATANRLAADGVRLSLWDADADAVAATAAAFNGQTPHTAHVDVTDQAAVEAAVQATIEALGGIDVLVNNAGIAGPTHTAWEYPVDAWRQVIEVDLIGVYLCCRAALPGMMERGWGRIVNIASIAGKEGNANASAYSAAKAGVIGLTKSLGKECVGTGILVNCVTPAAAQTDILNQVTEEFIEFMRSKIPMGRLCEVDEIAEMVVWLASDACSFSTGAVFDISGGRATY